MFKAYVFDIDGTLLDTSLTILDCIGKAIVSSGLSVDKSLINSSLIGPKIAEIVSILGISNADADKQAVVENFRNFYDNNPEPQTQLYSQGSLLLEKTKQQTSELFIATNKPIKPTKKLLNYFGLNCFKSIYTPDTYSDKVLSKTQMLQEIIKNNHLLPEDVLFIGDTKGDLIASKNVGCKFAFATWGYAENKAEIKEQSDIILDENSLNLI